MNLDRFLAASEQVATEDLDWKLARRVGLTPCERWVLTYFADIEGQTIVYLRDLLKTRVALEPDVIGFLSMWNYEEYFHGRALSRLLAECGAPLESHRIAQVRGSSTFREALETVLAALGSRLFARHFPALYMTWGASQELITLRGYEALERRTQNPVLAELARRIARQERRHFAWYFNAAKERLAESAFARRLTRFALERFWAPVGAAVKGPTQAAQMICTLFPGDQCATAAAEVDQKIGSLPGLEGIRLVGRFLMKHGSGASVSSIGDRSWQPA